MRKITPTLFALCATLLWVGAAQAQHYVDNGDGTVSDLTTGLMWEMKTRTPGVHDVSLKYTWNDKFQEGGLKPNGTAFIDFLGTLNNGTARVTDATITPGSCFANHCDWRLPTSEELRGILQAVPGCGLFQPCINPIFGPTQADYYWSATTLASEKNYALLANFYNSVRSGAASKTLSLYVRAVRGPN